MIECDVPTWFLTVADWLNQSLVSESEVANALIYLIDKGVASCLNLPEA